MNQANNEQNLSELIAEATQLKEQYENAQVYCGIIGLSGAGKSSLINAIAGEKIAQVGSIEQTMEAQEFRHGGTTFVDLPGCDTKLWPRETYIQKLGLQNYDCFILVTNTRLFEADIYLYEELQNKHNKPCFIVRTKIDQSIEAEYRENNLSEAETLDKIRLNLLEGIDPLPSKVYLTSAWNPSKWDLAILLRHIAESQDGIKHDRFVADMGTWSEQALVAKNAVANQVVSHAAIVSAANGLNPIPGLNLSIDIGILVNLSRQITHIYGLSNGQIEFLEKTSLDSDQSSRITGIKIGISRFLAKYLTTQAVNLVLAKMGRHIVVRNISRFLPFVGPLVAAGLGYKLTISFGEALIDDAQCLARQILVSATTVQQPHSEK